MAQILKRATELPKPPQVLTDPSPRVTGVIVSPPRVIQSVLPEQLALPRVQNVYNKNKTSPTTRSSTLKHYHPLVQNRLKTRRRLHPTKARLK